MSCTLALSPPLLSLSFYPFLFSSTFPSPQEQPYRIWPRHVYQKGVKKKKKRQACISTSLLCFLSTSFRSDSLEPDALCPFRNHLVLSWQLHASLKICIHPLGRSCTAATYSKKQHWQRTVNLYAPSLRFTHGFVSLCHISSLLRSPVFQVETLWSTQLLTVQKLFLPHIQFCCPSLLRWAEWLTACSSFRQRQNEFFYSFCTNT